MKHVLRKSETGQMMVEAIVALTIILVGLLGVFSLLSRSLSLNRTVNNQYIASNLAAEGIELVKNLIDRNVIQNNAAWNNGVAPGDYEMDYNDANLTGYTNRVLSFDSNDGHYSYDAGAPTNFRRKITLEQPSPNEVKVTSLVTWQGQGGNASEVKLQDHFFNWR